MPDAAHTGNPSTSSRSERKKKFAKLANSPKFHKVMAEYGKGELHSGGDGKKVEDIHQARAIATSEAKKHKSK